MTFGAWIGFIKNTPLHPAAVTVPPLALRLVAVFVVDRKSFYSGSFTFFCIVFSLLIFLFDMFSDHLPTNSLRLRVAIKCIHGDEN